MLKPCLTYKKIERKNCCYQIRRQRYDKRRTENKVMEDITLLKFIGLHPVLVHGGGPDISETLTRFGIQSEFVNGLRVTDDETMRVAQMVLMGKTNKEIVSLISQKRRQSIGSFRN